jgi:hypothetical protein
MSEMEHNSHRTHALPVLYSADHGLDGGDCLWGPPGSRQCVQMEYC